MRKNLIYQIVFFGLALILIINLANVSALGVTPGRKIVEFVSDEVKELSFKVINSEDKPVNLQIVVKGDISENFLFEEKSFIVPAGGEKDINYKITLPSELSPGIHSQEITIVEVSGASKEGSIGAVVGVITQLQIKVAYPGKYAEVEFNIESAEAEQQVSFYLPITNLGQEDLKEVQAEIEVFNSAGDKVAVVSTGKLAVKVGERKEVVGNWKADVSPGVYKAHARVSYDGKEAVVEKTFNIGEKILELTSVTVKDFTLGEIAKFEMDVQNKWSEDIKNVYSQTNVFDEDRTMIADFKSPTYDIVSLSNQTFYSYWDTEDIKKGTYDASIYLRYGEKFSKKNVQFEVNSDSIRTIGLGYVISEGKTGGDVKVKILITIIIILVILNLLWFVLLRKKMQKLQKTR